MRSTKLNNHKSPLAYLFIVLYYVPMLIAKIMLALFVGVITASRKIRQSGDYFLNIPKSLYQLFTSEVFSQDNIRHASDKRLLQYATTDLLKLIFDTRGGFGQKVKQILQGHQDETIDLCINRTHVAFDSTFEELGLTCPILSTIIEKPVRLHDGTGTFYEFSALKQWLDKNGNSPMTRMSCHLPKCEHGDYKNALEIAFEKAKENADQVIKDEMNKKITPICNTVPSQYPQLL